MCENRTIICSATADADARAAKAGLRITEIPVRLIYNDPTRHFGGPLDNPQFRLRHYLQVLDAEMSRPAPLAGVQNLAEGARPLDHVCDLGDCCCPG